MAETKIRLKSLTDGHLYEFDVAEFSLDTLWKAGSPANWDKLRSMLKPVLSRDFAVTDVVAQAFLDSVRHALDSSANPDSGSGVVRTVVTCETADGDAADALKALLEVGADPDLAGRDGWRASHVCGSFARIDVAALVFPCRPDMTALNQNGDTPLAAALKRKYKDDDKYPERPVLRPAIVKMLTDGNYDMGGFPKLAELACHKKWFAVKNLIRRQVVPATEFHQKFGGKSALEWAHVYKEEKVAKELEYYALPIAARLEQALSIIEGLQEEQIAAEERKIDAKLMLESESRIKDLQKQLIEERKKVQVRANKLRKAETELKTTKEAFEQEKKKAESARTELEQDRLKIGELQMLLETQIAKNLSLERELAERSGLKRFPRTPR